jgi:predicted RNA-binding Zn-ribbon protein involved in translation (DUF1610 family)
VKRSQEIPTTNTPILDQETTVKLISSEHAIARGRNDTNCPNAKETMIERTKRAACRLVKLVLRYEKKTHDFGTFEFAKNVRVNATECDYMIWRRKECK